QLRLGCGGDELPAGDRGRLDVSYRASVVRELSVESRQANRGATANAIGAPSRPALADHRHGARADLLSHAPLRGGGEDARGDAGAGSQLCARALYTRIGPRPTTPLWRR